jgi:hypothetical protein
VDPLVAAFFGLLDTIGLLTPSTYASAPRTVDPTASLARISHLKRSFGLRRPRLRRLGGARSWVGLGIFAYNLQPMTVVAG